LPSSGGRVWVRGIEGFTFSEVRFSGKFSGVGERLVSLGSSLGTLSLLVEKCSLFSRGAVIIEKGTGIGVEEEVGWAGVARKAASSCSSLSTLALSLRKSSYKRMCSEILAELFLFCVSMR
jgi:hypothetical protein